MDKNRENEIPLLRHAIFTRSDSLNVPSENPKNYEINELHYENMSH